MIKISKKEARLVLLRHQELHNPRQINSPDDIVRFIKKIGCIQYDPLNKAGRNADLVLQSRCDNYNEETLYNLLYKQRQLIDGWDKCMSIWSINDWPCFERIREHYRIFFRERAKELGPTRNLIRKLVNGNGAINSSAIKLDQKVDWGWSPTKIGRVVLENMFHCGELAIHHKEGTRKYYDFSEKLLPNSVQKAKDPNKSKDDYNDWYTERRINSIGLLWNKSGDAWLGIRDLGKDARTNSINHLLANNVLEMVKIEGLNDSFYMKKKFLSLLNDNSEHHEASIIAPLDNLIWDRKLTQALFDFDYKWEVYTPVKKRKFGYYVLPVLCGDRFVARFEPVLDRKKGVLVVKNWWWEENANIDSQTIEALIRCFTAFLGFTKMTRIQTTTKKIQNTLKWIAACKNMD